MSRARSVANILGLNYVTAEQLPITRYGDVAVGSDLNNQAIRNSVFYSLNPTNAPHSNNGLGMYLSSFGLGGSNNTSTDERAAQLYFGDTPVSGMYYRVKQGTSGWHPWVSLSSGIRSVNFASTNEQTYTDNQTGFTILETTFIRTLPSASSKFLVIATVNGAALDDAHGRVEFYNGSSWVTPTEFVGSDIGGAGSFGDFSVVRAIENKQTVQYTAVFVHSPASTSATLGYRVRLMAENTNGFFLNRPTGTDGGFNTNTSRSTLLIMELTGNV